VRKISFPSMGNSSVVFRDVMEGLGNEVVFPPKPTEKTLSLGARYSPEFACVPYKIVLGTYIEALEAGANTLVTSGGCGPCRAGLYGNLHDVILKDLGYDFEMIIFELPRFGWRDFFNNIRKVNSKRTPLPRLIKVIRAGWNKLVALDEIEKLSHIIRPRETNKGETTHVYRQCLAQLDKAQTLQDIRQARAEGERKLRSIPQDPTKKPLRVGLVGEIYVLIEPFANLDIEQTLGELGVEVHRSIYLSGWTLDNTVTDTLGQVGGLDIKKAAAPYLPEMIGGHGQDSIGNTIIYANRGFDGVVQLSPFTCIPEIVAKSILPQVSKDYSIPVLSVACDELTGKAGLQTRLEAFVDLMERKRRREAS
jgi:predicted nucleotide-binding protein (sugar kinase/HSP70/actin superfamily)